ncbi:MAG: transposase [Halofilum sp. (in: g-proteobacteria)]|nr:transposase [Halofilum sp. (in: g-proteobacteria)]
MPCLVTMVVRNRSRVFADWDKACACARVLHEFPAVAPIESLAWVIMPDHAHWLFSLEGLTLGKVMRRFKSYSARKVNAVDGIAGPLWQAGYHDHAVRHEEDLRTIARYVVGNPVRAGLCERVEDYPFWDAIWLRGDGATGDEP